MKKILLYSAFVFALAACGNDDNGSPSGNTTAGTTSSTTGTTSGTSNCGTITVTRNGTTETVSSQNNTLITEQYPTGESGRRLDIRANVPGGMLILTAGSPVTSTLPANVIPARTYYPTYHPNASCEDLNGEEYCDEMLATFIASGNVTYMSIDETAPAYITISSINGNTKKVSGSYNVRVEKFGGSDADTMRISGTFTDVCYTVIN